MSNLKALLIRKKFTDKQITGELFIFSEKGTRLIFSCKTLELAYRKNQNRISAIPAEVYNVVPRYSAKHKNHFHVLDVPNRSFILFHGGNYYTQIEGCILVGDSLADINKDGELDVLNSLKTLAKLREIAPDGFELMITNDQ